MAAELRGGARDRPRQRRVGCRLVVERTVRLDVLHLDPLCAAEGLERTDLVAHERLDLVGVERKRTPTEVEEVGIAGLSADRHAGTPAHGHRRLHYPEIAGVEPAGEIGAGDVGDQALVVAELPAARSSRQGRR